MKRRLSWLLAIVSLLSVSTFAQEVQFKSFELLERDLYARTHERLDLNEEPCAAVRVAVPKANQFQFEGNVVGSPIYTPGEVIVYMPEGSNSLTVKSEEYGTLKVEFPLRLKKQSTYRLQLQLVLSDDKKIRTLVMPVVGVGKIFSGGAMIALVRKTGAYLKVKYNFVGLTTDYECDAQGVLVGQDAPSFFTGQKKKARLALTGGILQRVAKPVYLYAGAGWGYKRLGWELADGTWAKNLDSSYQGVEADLGGIYRIKNIALMAGVQTNQFKYWEGTIGVGIMF